MDNSVIFKFRIGKAYRCTESGPAVDGYIATLPITTSPTHIQIVTTALRGKVVDVQPDVVAPRLPHANKNMFALFANYVQTLIKS